LTGKLALRESQNCLSMFVVIGHFAFVVEVVEFAMCAEIAHVADCSVAEQSLRTVSNRELFWGFPL
jgi:hypothetical protein